MCLRAPAGSRAKGNRSSDGTRGQKPSGKQVRGKKAPQKQRTCEDCEDNEATQYCVDCQPPLVLCDDCAVLLHRGVTRRNHQLKGMASYKGLIPELFLDIK